jgi:hypothetical protein
MCLACQMEDELWFAYLEQVAQEKRAAAPSAPAAPRAEPAAPPAKAAPASPFACEELPPE